MCGIIGVIGNGINATDLKIYRQMLVADTFRGIHSTGQFAIGAGSPFTYYKRACPGWDFLEHKAADKMLTVSQRAIIGHNRYATTGAVNNVNAHPFATDHIIGVHNGSLWDTSALKDDHLYDVDSEALFNDICVNGIEHSASVADGAFALVWYDSRDRMLRFVRNEQRPLAMYLHPDRDVVYIASEIDMLRWIVGRNDTAKFDEGLLMEVPAGDLWEFDLSRTSHLTEHAANRKITVNNTYKPVKTTWSYGSTYYGGQNYGSSASKKQSGTSAAVKGKQKGFAELCAEYKVSDNHHIVADFTHISMNTANKTRTYNVSGKVLWPEKLKGITVSCYGVSEDIGGAGIFEGTMQTIFQTMEGETRVVMNNKKGLKYLGDDKEVLNFQKKSLPAKA